MLWNGRYDTLETLVSNPNEPACHSQGFKVAQKRLLGVDVIESGLYIPNQISYVSIWLETVKTSKGYIPKVLIWKCTCFNYIWFLKTVISFSSSDVVIPRRKFPQFIFSSNKKFCAPEIIMKIQLAWIKHYRV
jgi:hypothetical protein